MDMAVDSNAAVADMARAATMAAVRRKLIYSFFVRLLAVGVVL